MKPALRLTNAPDLKLHPEDLFKQLESSVTSFEDLVKQLNCSIDDLDETLQAPETSQLLRQKIQITCLQVQLLALRVAPHCIGRLVALTNESEKPEVTRRSATTLLHVAGIATYTQAQQPAPAPVPTPPPEDKEAKELNENDQHRNNVMSGLHFLLRLRKWHNLDLSLLKTNEDLIAQAIIPFLKNPNTDPNNDPPKKPA